MAGRSMFASPSQAFLELSFAGQTLRLDAKSSKLALGRGADAALTLNDPRVSRMHATLEWRGGHFVLTDASSYGTWVYLGNQSEAVVLRRTECYLVGSGHIVPGCDRTDDNAPLVAFSIRT
jgi:hypothetical protein